MLPKLNDHYNKTNLGGRGKSQWNLHGAAALQCTPPQTDRLAGFSCHSTTQLCFASDFDHLFVSPCSLLAVYHRDVYHVECISSSICLVYGVVCTLFVSFLYDS